MNPFIDTLLSGVGQTDVAYTIVRAATGAFFAISGYHKLFNADRHATLVDTLRGDGVPLVSVNQWFVPGVELFAGMALIIGMLTPLAALGLLVICGVACVVDGFARIKGWSPIDKADVVDDVLYLPEAIYILILLLVIAHGGGAYSVDRLLVSLL